MLHELRIENLLLIERAELRFAGGLNAITGETGAGKTILAHSLDLLMGGKARPQIVRPGADEAYVEGVFALPEELLADPELAELRERLPAGTDEIVLGRRIAASGRTSAFVQRRSASAGDLRALGSRLLAFYGQHEHRRLVLSSAQLEILDGFAGAEQLERRGRYRDAHAEVVALSRELAELAEREGARERDLDLFRFELAEIEAAAPDPDEERELEAERDRLRHAEGLRAAASGALAAIAGADDDLGGARGLLGGAERDLAAVDGVDASLDAIAERVRAVAVELDDAASALRSYLEGIEAEPGRLELVEERLHAVDRLKRKHGGSIEAVLSHRERCRAEIDRLENAERLTGELERRLDQASKRGARRLPESSARRGQRPPAGSPSGSPPSSPSWAWRGHRSRCRSIPTPTASARTARRRSSCAWPPTRGSPPRRFATPPRAGSCRESCSRSPAWARGPAPERWSSTRSTPESAATPRARRGRGCGGWAPSAR